MSLARWPWQPRLCGVISIISAPHNKVVSPPNQNPPWWDRRGEGGVAGWGVRRWGGVFESLAASSGPQWEVCRNGGVWCGSGSAADAASMERCWVWCFGKVMRPWCIYFQDLLPLGITVVTPGGKRIHIVSKSKSTNTCDKKKNTDKI